MILFSPRVRALMANPAVAKFYMLDLEGLRSLTTYFRSLPFNQKTFVNSGELLLLEPPEMTSTVTRQRFTALFQDVQGQEPLRNSGNLIGRRASVYVVFEENGEPLLSQEDVVLLYRGRIDNSSLRVKTGAVGERYTELSFASPMADLDAVNTYYASQDYADRNFPGDRSYEQIYTGSAGVNLVWGKE